jgi:hypothetical protein
MAFLFPKKSFSKDMITAEIELTKLEIARLTAEIANLPSDLPPAGTYLSSYTSKGDMISQATQEHRRYKYYCLAHREKILTGRVKRIHIGRSPEPKLRDAIKQIEMMEIREAKKKALSRYEERLAFLVEGNWHIVDGSKNQGNTYEPSNTD